MKRFLLLTVILLCALAARPQAQLRSIDVATSAGSITAAVGTGCTANSVGCVVVPLGGFTGVAVQISGTWTGTITLGEVTLDGLTWSTVNMTPPNSTTPATTTTSNGYWNGTVVGKTFRVRATATITGTAVVNVYATLH